MGVYLMPAIVRFVVLGCHLRNARGLSGVNPCVDPRRLRGGALDGPAPALDYQASWSNDTNG